MNSVLVSGKNCLQWNLKCSSLFLMFWPEEENYIKLFLIGIFSKLANNTNKFVFTGML